MIQTTTQAIKTYLRENQVEVEYTEKDWHVYWVLWYEIKNKRTNWFDSSDDLLFEVRAYFCAKFGPTPAPLGEGTER